MSVPRSAGWRLAAALTSAVVAAGGAVAGHVTATATAPLHGAPTVVAVVEPGGFNPYHLDFAASLHPWAGGDPSDDLPLTSDPATYIAGYPSGATALNITLPTSGSDDVNALHAADAAAWAAVPNSTSTTSPSLYYIPGTKVIGAVRFDSAGLWAGNDAHGTHSAASAVGNIHGTCPECLVVLVAGTGGLEWAQRQPWIDVVTNSYESTRQHGNEYVRPGLVQGIYTQRSVVEAGQSVLWSAGNGVVNSLYDVPQLTYVSGQRGPDWVITVGGTRNGNPLPGTGRPADIAAEAESYPSTGGTTANGTGTHSGTSNAAPVVAGALGTVIQRGRDALGDTTGGHSAGVVASGTAVTCGSADPACPLGDGVLTRQEAENTLFHTVTPGTQPEDLAPVPVPARTVGPAVPDVPTLPAPRAAYLYVGHGVVHGREKPAAMAAEQARAADALRGLVAVQRPYGEKAWMTADSRCRQLVWGSWGEGYFTGTLDDDGSSALATAWNTWCTPETAAQLREASTL